MSSSFPDSLLRKKSFVAVLYIVASMYFFAVISKMYAVYEMYPIVLLLALHTVLFTFLKIPYLLKQQPLLAANRQ